MRFLIFGAGAVGSLIGGSLARKHEVTLVARRPHVEAIRRRGLVIRGREEEVVRVHAVEEVEEADRPDVVVITVKSYDTEDAVGALRPFWGSAAFLPLQNGLGNVELVSRFADRVFGGVSYHGVTLLGPGEIYYAGRGDTVLGPARGASVEEAEEIASGFRECGLSATVTGDIGAALWSKAVLNACFNPLTGLLRARSGALADSEALRACCQMVVDEALAVAGEHGVTLDRAAILARVDDVARLTSRNKSSMLQDLEKGRRTEIDAINGAIARMGREKGIHCPVNETLTLLVKAAEHLQSDPGDPPAGSLVEVPGGRGADAGA